MGWGRTLLLGDIGNRLDIEDTERDIVHLKQEMSVAFRRDLSQDQQISQLIDENAELKLYLVGVIRLLAAKGVISSAELRAMVDAVDSNRRFPGQNALSAMGKSGNLITGDRGKGISIEKEVGEQMGRRELMRKIGEFK